MLEKTSMTLQEKLAMDRAYYLEHPLIHYSFNQRPIMDFSHKGCDEYNVVKYDITELHRLNYAVDFDLTFKNATNNIGVYLYPIYFRKKISEDTFTNKKWSNVFIVDAKYIHTDKDGHQYIHVFIQNATCLEIYLQIFSELYQYVDIEYTKQVIQKCNEAVYEFMNIDYTTTKLDEIGVVRDVDMLKRAESRVK